jgi:energy-coupling factor transporter ATP-binding protein EcfA2
MTNRVTSIRLFRGAPVTDPAEIACARRLRRDLSAAGINAILLANVTLGPKRRQIDLIVATAATAIVVEIKAYIHSVRGGVNGRWSIAQDDGSRRALDGANPYQQALENRFTVTDCLRGRDGSDLKDAIGGMLCLYPTPPAGSAIPAGDFKLSIGGYADLLALLKLPRANALTLEQWEAFAHANGLANESDRPPSAAEQIMAKFHAAHADLSRATLGPYVEPLFGGDESSEGLAARSAEGEQFQIIGPSGSGKTELLKRLRAACAAGGNLPILIRGRDFDRDVGPLLRADTARYTSATVPTLFRAATGAGAEIILHVDAVNECPADRRADLIAALQAARINYGARIILTGQDEIALPASLTGATISLQQPERVQAQRIVEAHLARPLRDSEVQALEVVGTAHDAAILATVLDRASAIDGRFSLYHAFMRARLGAAAPQAFRGLADLATAMRTGFLRAMPMPAAERIVDPQDVSRIQTARSAGLLWSEHGRVGFRHDLIGDFFAAEAVLRRADSPEALAALARQPIHAELREFLLGGCAMTSEIEALLSNAPDSRLLESALSGRAGQKAKDYLLSRMRDLIADLKRRYVEIELTLPDGVTSARELSSLVPALADPESGSIDDLYLNLIPAALDNGLLPDLLDLFAAVDRRLVDEAARLKKRHPDFRLAWRAAAYGTVYGMHHFTGARHLQNLLNAIQNSWAHRDEKHGTLGLAAYLDAFEALSVGQLFLLIAALRCARDEPMPSRFPELLQHVWRTQVYHLRLMISDIIRFRGSELAEIDRETVRELLNGYLSNDNIFLNSSVIDAMAGVGGIEHDFTIEAAVEEYEALLAMPESPEACSLAVSAVTRTYDHPYSDLYWEAFYDVLAVEKRQALLLRGLRERPGDPWFIADILRALRRDPTREAEPELQRIALWPRLDGHSHQYAILSFAEAIGLLATLELPLVPPDAPPQDATMRAWYHAAPLIHALNGGEGNPSVEAFLACGVSSAFDVVQRLRREARNIGFGSHPDIAFESRWPDMIRDLSRAVLTKDYVAASAFARFQFGRSLEEDHVDAALQLLAIVGRPTDLKLVQTWLPHARHGEQALATARALEAERTG